VSLLLAVFGSGGDVAVAWAVFVIVPFDVDLRVIR
jgi:hypothetical protein